MFVLHFISHMQRPESAMDSEYNRSDMILLFVWDEKRSPSSNAVSMHSIWQRPYWIYTYIVDTRVAVQLQKGVLKQYFIR